MADDAGTRLCEGLGFANGDRSIVVAYWMTPAAAARLNERIAAATASVR